MRFRRRNHTSRGEGPGLAASRRRLLQWMLLGVLVLSLAAGIYLLIGFSPAEIPLEAENGAPVGRPLPPPEMDLEPPRMVPADPEPGFPEAPPAAMEPREPRGNSQGLPPEPGVLPEQTYVGPVAPEYTGTPAPAEFGLVDAELFGKQVLGVRPELLERLQRMERAFRGSVSGVEMLVAYRQGKGAHTQGLAIDVNYFANPYVMHERGETERDARLGPVYHRIAQLMLGRNSVIPEELIHGSPSPSRTLRLYRALGEESRAMIAYFRLMRDREALERFLRARGTAAGGFTAGSLQPQMMRDYVTLSGRSGPRVPGLEYPAPELFPGDPPFSGDANYRGPELGFLGLNERLLRAFTEAGLRWGGTDMGDNSGDLMHFYLTPSLANESLRSRPRGDNPLGGVQK